MTRDVAALVAQDTLGRILARQLRHLVMRDVPLTSVGEDSRTEK
jgi:hypothetical protein